MRKIFRLAIFAGVLAMAGSCSSFGPKSDYDMVESIMETTLEKIKNAQSCDELMQLVYEAPEGYDEHYAKLTEEEKQKIDTKYAEQLGDAISERMDKLECLKQGLDDMAREEVEFNEEQ